MTAWSVARATGSAAELHARPLGNFSGDAVVERAVHVWTVDAPALVLGSAQPSSDVDAEACAAAGVEVVRRRSGGGAVLLDPGAAVWVDVEVPRGDPLWDDDVGRAMWWLGGCWAAALGAVGVAGAEVHRGGLVTTEWSRLVCFAGLGPGEVTVGGGKTVGISQRRTRAGARFQCAVPTRWEPERLAGLLALPADRQAALVAAIAGVVAPVEAPAGALVEAFLAALPGP